MIWSRAEVRPTRYGGVLFRSALEAGVAEQLDNLGITWEYERPAYRTLEYLPDFTLGPCEAEMVLEFDLPQWLEVKPSGLLYALRDHFRLPERFDDAFPVEITAQELQAGGFEEIWKPKRLAELSGLAVLVVHSINRNRTLSALMLPASMELTRSHPLVCYKRVLANRKRQEQEARWQAEAAERQAAYEEEARQWRRQAIAAARVHKRPARFDGWCRICNQQRPSAALVIYQEDGRWVALCRAHLSYVTDLESEADG